MAGLGPQPAGGEAELEVEDLAGGGFTEINIVPLVDIMLVLLVILMASSTAILEQGQGQGAGFKVKLPAAADAPEVKGVADSLVIAVLSDGQVVSQGEALSAEALSALLAAEAQKGADRLVLVQADADTYHHRVVEVMEAARKAGLSNLAIATRPEEP